MRFRSGFGVVLIAVLLSLMAATAVAGTNIDISDIEAPSYVEPGESLRVEVTVENTASEDVHQIEVKAKGFNQVKEENLWGIDSGEEDTIVFYLDAPEDERGTHEIQVTAQSRDDDGNVIGGESKNVSVDVEESGVVQPHEGELRIEEISLPSTVMAGDTLKMDVSARNTGNNDMNGLHVAVTAFGRTSADEFGTLEDNTTRTFPVKISVPAASQGLEEMEIEVSSFRHQDTINTTVSISDVHATLNLHQEEVTVGDHVTVSGILNRRNTRADLFYGDNFEAPVISDETGHYTHTIIPEKSGNYPVTLRIGTVEKEKYLKVKPEVGIRQISVPDRVSSGSVFDVCTSISRSTDGEVEISLSVDDQIRKTETFHVSGEVEHCLSTSLSSTGEHTIGVEVSSGGVAVTEESTVRSIETGISASVFPDHLTLTKGQAGVFRVDISNDQLERRQFNIRVDGFENLSVQSPDTIDMDRGSSKTDSVRVVPESTGTYEGTITVSHRGTVIAESPVEVLAVENPALRNPVIGGAAQRVMGTVDSFTDLRQRQKWLFIAFAAVLILVTGWYWRRRKGSVIEPQY